MLRGAEIQVVNIPGGVRITGEDFLFSASGYSSGGTWYHAGAAPVGPSSMANTALVDFARVYSQFRIVAAAACYIPGVATTATGQIAMYYRSNRIDPAITPSSASFLPWVLSGNNGVVAPAWQPTSLRLVVGKEWLDTEPLCNVDPNREVDGELFLASNIGVNTVPSPSPGLVKLQYVVEFRGFARNPKAAMLPVPDQIYTQLGCGINNESVSTGNGVNFRCIYPNIAGNTLSSPGHANYGDVYKLIIDSTTFSSGTGETINNIWRINFNSSNFVGYTFDQPVMTVYGVVVSINPTNFAIYDTFAGAVSGAAPFTYSYTKNPSSYVFNSVMASLVGSLTTKGNLTI